jgi:DNA repair protein RadA/Sms
MAKKNISFICQSCSYQSTKWMGKCPECNEWNTFVEEVSIKEKDLNRAHKRTATQNEVPKLVSEIEVLTEKRIKTDIGEFDRVVGGGLVPGSLILIGGEPGIGKSTLLTKVMSALSNKKLEDSVLYVSGEESLGQVADRAKRIGFNNSKFYIYNETNWQKILEQINKLTPRFLVIDSIQTTSSSDIDSAPGTVSQIREVTYELMNHVKSRGITCFIIGHITKEGTIAGPKILEHMVDTVIYFEGDQFGHYRLLRAIKNRFGNTMKESGLHEVKNPSQFFLDEELEGSFGRSLTCVLEGTRSLFIEIQALVVENKFGNGRRTTQGIDNNRLSMMVAVIEKYFGIPLSFNDIYLNVVGGMKLLNRESDLSIIASLISSYRGSPIDSSTVFVGEVGLSGEVRSVPMMETRIKEMAQLSYKKIICSDKTAKEFKGKYKIELVGIKSAKEIEKFL